MGQVSKPGQSKLKSEREIDAALTALYRRLGKADPMVRRVDDALCALIADAEDAGAARQREIIAAALDGSMTWHQDSMPQWDAA